MACLEEGYKRMRHVKKLILTLAVTILALGAVACGQRVPLETPPDRVQDTTEY